MLRRRTIALIVLLLTIIVACVWIRVDNTVSTTVESTQPNLNEHESEPIVEPDSPTSDSPAVIEREVTTQPEPTPAPPPDRVTNGGCYIGGCSSQLCTDNPDIASTCEWRESYACYRTATCERQANGQCGFTPTNELKACLAASAETETTIEIR